MVSKFNLYTVHLKCFDSIRYNLNQNKTLTKNFNRTRTYVHTYIHTDTVKQYAPKGTIVPGGIISPRQSSQTNPGRTKQSLIRKHSPKTDIFSNK